MSVVFVDIVGCYVDFGDCGVYDDMFVIEWCNFVLFGYGVKGMMLLMVEIVIVVIDGCILVVDIYCLVEIGKGVLCYLVELLLGICVVVKVVG